MARGTRIEKSIVRYEVHAPWAFIDNELVWGWVPYNKWNPVHWFLKRRMVKI